MSARGNARCGADCYPAASESGWVVAVMVDTFGIPRVVDARGTSFGRQQIQRTPQPFVRPLTCGGRTCSAAAVAVVGYLRLQTWVEPMFRLGPGAEHSEGCPFNVDHRIDDLVKAHRAVVEPKAGQYRSCCRSQRTPRASLGCDPTPRTFATHARRRTVPGTRPEPSHRSSRQRPRSCNCCRTWTTTRSRRRGSSR